MATEKLDLEKKIQKTPQLLKTKKNTLQFTKLFFFFRFFVCKSPQIKATTISRDLVAMEKQIKPHVKTIQVQLHLLPSNFHLMNKIDQQISETRSSKRLELTLVEDMSYFTDLPVQDVEELIEKR